MTDKTEDGGPAKKTLDPNIKDRAPAEANARLIAAAPDLVEALRDLVSDREEVAKYSWKTWMNGEWHWNDEIWERNDPDEFELIKAARAALSKALGEGQ